MATYVLRRLLLFIPSLLGVTVVIFVLMRLVPGDIAEIIAYDAGSDLAKVVEQQVKQIRHELGLDRPVAQQYVDWLQGALTGDFGYSYWEKRPVVNIIRERFPRSMELALLTIILAMLWAVPLGVISAVRQNTWADYGVRILSISGLSLPLFLTGILILYVLVRFFYWWSVWRRSIPTPSGFTSNLPLPPLSPPSPLPGAVSWPSTYWKNMAT